MVLTCIRPWVWSRAAKINKNTYNLFPCVCFGLYFPFLFKNLFVFWDRFLLCIPDWPPTHDSALAFQVLGLQVCTSRPGWFVFFSMIHTAYWHFGIILCWMHILIFLSIYLLNFLSVIIILQCWGRPRPHKCSSSAGPLNVATNVSFVSFFVDIPLQVSKYLCLKLWVHCFLVVLGIELYHLGHAPSPFTFSLIFEMGGLIKFCLVWPQTVILLSPPPA
jgi:hypothetical protein